jgi:hypothetical protein
MYSPDQASEILEDVEGQGPHFIDKVWARATTQSSTRLLHFSMEAYPVR